MLKPYEMSKVIITGHNNIQENIIKELHKLGILHVVEHSKDELADIGKPLESANKLSEILVKVRALITALGIKKEENKFKFKIVLSQIESTTRKLNEEASTNLEELKRIEDFISKNEAIKQELEILKNIDIPIEAFITYRSLVYFTGYVKNQSDILVLKKELSKITDNFMFFDDGSKNRSFVVLFIDIKNKEHASNLLKKSNFFPVNLTNLGNLKGNAANNLRKIDKENVNISKKKEIIKKRIEKLGAENKEFLIIADEFLSEQLEKAEAPLKFAATQSSFLIKGWIPTDQLKYSVGRLNKISKNKIFVHSEAAKKEDKVPVKLKNHKYAKPFEFFINLYSIPLYREIDPTFLIFLTFPIFFGLMLGDIGYGVVSYLFFMFLKKKFPKLKGIFNALLLASAVSIFFGFVYGEIFGLEEIFGFHLPHLLSRVNEIFTLLYIVIGIGVVHVNIGLIIGFINELKSHGLSTAIYGKASWMVLQIGVGLLALSYYSSISSAVGYGFLILSIVMLIKGEGIKGIIELPSIFTNILSYARLMAIGLSSVSLASVINESASGFFHKGGFFILAGILVLIIGHVFNLVLGLFGSFLHSIRLHYVEFFSKFFQGGAEKYKPFGVKE